MRVNEISIQRYGERLSSFNHRFEKDLTVIFGPNGSGKTLIIDAILKMVMGKPAKNFIVHEGVDENPKGHLVVETGGTEHTLDGNKVLSDAGIDIDPHELKSIFVIEDGDLEITDEDEFYGRITDKLIGVRTKDIQQIKKELRQRGRLTEGLRISGKAPHHAKSKLEDAKELKIEIDEYIEEAESEDAKRWEGKRLSLESKLRELETQIETLEKAGRKAEFEKLSKSLTDLEEQLKELENLPDEEQLIRLRDNMRDLDKEISKRSELKREETLWQDVFQRSIIVGPIALIFLLILGLVNAALPILALGLLGLLVISIVKRRTVGMALAGMDKMEESLVAESKKVGLDVDNLEEISERIDKINDKKKEADRSFEQRRGVIDDKFGIEEDDRRKFVEEARKELEGMKKDVDLDVDIAYDKDELERIKSEKEEAEEELEGLEEKLESHKDRLNDFSQRAHELKFSDEFLIIDLDLEVDNLESLKELSNWLEGFIENVERDAELSRVAHEIFEELESEEKSKSESLFQEGNKASQILKEITDGMFQEVSYSVEEGEVYLDRKGDQGRQKASELSRGEWNQLYIAIRMALGERLLGGEKGFFIVEEPFIHADSQRLLRQFELLKKLSRSGWQTIYFTAKDEIKDLLPKYKGAELIELKGPTMDYQ